MLKRLGAMLAMACYYVVAVGDSDVPWLRSLLMPNPAQQEPKKLLASELGLRETGPAV
jgi:hypothetical protein